MGLSSEEQQALAADVARQGWAVTPPVVAQLELDRVLQELAPRDLRQRGQRAARSLLARAPAVRALAASPAVRSVAAAVLGPDCFAVRAALGDDLPPAAADGGWHQDVRIAVRARSAAPGYAAWSETHGVPHVEPPPEVLEGMLVLRLPLADEPAPPLRLLSGSHRVGRLSPDAIASWSASAAVVTCAVERGGILVFRPLLLHAPPPPEATPRTRALTLEFAAAELAGTLDWHDRVS